MKGYKNSPYLCCLVVCTLLTACGSDGVFQRYTPIEALKAHPEDYQMPSTAKIKATVLATTDLLGISACKVEDGTSTIYIISSRGYREGDDIIIKGHVENILGKSSWKLLVFYEDY